MKVAIIGYGFVGKAIENALHDSVELYLVDPILKTKVADLSNFMPQIIFVCVPTPMNDDGSQNSEIINSVIHEINELSLESKIVIKSTVLPDVILEIEKIVPKVVYNPEFLREKHAFEDFIESEIVIFGGEKDTSIEIGNFYKNHTRCKCNEFQFTDLVTASLVKYSINTFLATKVVFFNEIFNIFRELSRDDKWDEFISIISKDERMGSSHMSVPGHDGRYGFGGACLPKDTLALLKYSKGINQQLSLLKKSVEINNNIRSKYQKKTQREYDQNVEFKIGNKD